MLTCRNHVMKELCFFSFSFLGIWCYDVFLLPENGGGQHGKFGADGLLCSNCLGVLWSLDGYLSSSISPFWLTVQIVSAICDCWVISLSRFCWLELFGVAFTFCDARPPAVHGIPDLCTVVSLNLGPPTAFCIENNPAKDMILAGICVVFATW